jgi:thiosulfate/3-mercaptopyruvate sulfurtransferase
MIGNKLIYRSLFILLLIEGIPLISPFPSTQDGESATTGHVSIIEVAQLVEIQESATILDARGSHAFRMGHIPGSLHVDWKDWNQERADIINAWFGKPEKWGLLREPSSKLRDELRRMGISNSKKVVVIGEPGGWGEEGRIAWDLLYWGIDEVALLNGGFETWANAPDCPIETGGIQIPKEGDFSFQLRPERRVLWEDVKEAVHTNSRTIIDARTTAEYNGKKLIGQKRAGRIPNAILLPAGRLYQSDGTYITKEELTRLLPADTVVNPLSYCVGGIRSGLLAMLWEAYNGTVMANYDGSIWEWSSITNLPLVK